MSILAIGGCSVLAYILAMFTTYYIGMRCFWNPHNTDGEEVFLSLVWPIYWFFKIPGLIFKRICNKAANARNR
jgi:hypothetical protein